jgi:hypothetical protein
MTEKNLEGVCPPARLNLLFSRFEIVAYSYIFYQNGIL